jgi:hypothetical protein
MTLEELAALFVVMTINIELIAVNAQTVTVLDYNQGPQMSDEFKVDKNKARKDYHESKYDALNSGDTFFDGISYITGHCAGQRSRQEELDRIRKQLEEAEFFVETVSKFTDHDAELLGYQDGDAPTESSKFISRAREYLKKHGGGV